MPDRCEDGAELSETDMDLVVAGGLGGNGVGGIGGFASGQPLEVRAGLFGQTQLYRSGVPVELHRAFSGNLFTMRPNYE